MYVTVVFYEGKGVIMKKEITRDILKSLYVDSARKLFEKELGDLKPHELNAVIADVVQKNNENYQKSMNNCSKKKVAIYFSIEFLIGRVVLDILVNCGIKKATTRIFKEEGIDINCLEDVDDAALGNGGLGRLAACFIESAATESYPLYGVGLYYKYGLFKQSIKDDSQVEFPDEWTKNGEPWFEPKEDEAVIVKFQDTQVKAIPYFLPIVGYNTSRTTLESTIYPLMVWKAEAADCGNQNALRISDYLYPDDSTDDGKYLRLRQEYFLVSATLQRLLNIHMKEHHTLDNFEEYYCFQMNDTHPVIGAVEFIRLLETYGYSFKDAFKKARKCFAYTNHTIMAEALEKWPIIIFKNLLPELFKVIEDINLELVNELSQNDMFCTKIIENGVIKTNPDWQRIKNYEMFDAGIIYMSRIACYISYSINGVAKVHSNIIKKETLNQWYKLYPEKFNNKTNGVTPRRWIKLANPALAAFLDKYVGKGWITDLVQLEKLEKYKNNQSVLAEFAGVKKIAKHNLAEYIKNKEGIKIDENSIFDCQVKRIHEYKRQAMNALRILLIYDGIKRGELPNFYKTTFMIGGKAAPGYHMAKEIIKLIKDIQNLINNDPEVKDKMQVVFLTNFNVSYGEKVYSGANFSEQISTAGTEASGTSNMKFMMNGAPTIGTLDGANIEIVEEASQKNEYIFGATVDELNRIKPIYHHKAFLDANKDIVRVLDYLKNGKLNNTYWDLYNTFMYDDRYFTMYDLRSYFEVTLRANADYAAEIETGDYRSYTQKCFENTAHSGRFSSDRTIREYAEEIWKVEKDK